MLLLDRWRFAVGLEDGYLFCPSRADWSENNHDPPTFYGSTGTRTLTAIQDELRERLLSLLGDRIATGEVLISPSHFLDAIAEDYQMLTGSAASEDAKNGLSSLLDEVNKSTPDLLLIPGIENWITKSVHALMRKKSWGVTEVHEGGNQLVRDFVKSAQVKALLQGLKITPNQLNVRRCLHTINYRVAGKEDPQQKKSLARLAQARANAKTAVPAAGGAPRLTAQPKVKRGCRSCFRGRQRTRVRKRWSSDKRNRRKPKKS